jgi:hypothetical protein
MTENNAAQPADQEIEAIMEQAQVFASAWAFLGGPFDNGSGLEQAERERSNLRALLSKLRAEGVQAGDERESEHIETLQRMRADYNPSDGPMSELKATALDAAIAALASAPVAGEAREGLAPPKCPITGRPFFMALEHAELGSVPTYGGPYDSYTIPHLGGKADQPWHERELRVYRYDHDLGGWRTDEVEVIPLRIVHEDVLNERHDAAPQASEAVRDALEMLIREAQAAADDYHRPRYTRLDEAISAARAALSAQPSGNPGELSAQPGAQKNGGSDAN